MFLDWAVKHRKFLLIIVFIYSIGVRLFFVATMPEEMKILKSDDKTYDHLAMSLLTKREFSKNNIPIAWRGPGYPLFLASVYFFFGHNHLAVRIIQSIIMSLLILIIYLISRETFGRKVAVVSVVLGCFYQPFIYYLYWAGSAFFMTEGFFTFLLAISVFLLIKFQKTNKFKYQVLSGIMLGITCLTRAVIMLLPFYLFLWFWLTDKSFKIGLRRAIPIIFFMGITILPWTVRNYLVFHEFIPVTNEAGDIFLGGNNPQAKGGWAPILSKLEKDPENLRKYSETYIKRQKYKEGLEYLLSNPRRIPYLFIKKILVQWNVFNEFGGYNIWYGLAGSFAIFGVFYAFRHYGYKNHILFLLLFGYVTMVAVIFFGAPRYRYPIEPYLVIFSSLGVKHLLFEEQQRRALSSFLLFWSIIFVNIFLYINAKGIIAWISKIVP